MRILRPESVKRKKGRVIDVESGAREGQESRLEAAPLCSGPSESSINVSPIWDTVRVSSVLLCLSNLDQSCCRRAGYGWYFAMRLDQYHYKRGSPTPRLTATGPELTEICLLGNDYSLTTFPLQKRSEREFMTLEGASAVFVIRWCMWCSLPSGGFVQAVR